MNKHIKEFLDHYIEFKNPEYAILLSGKWGSGKTYFIDHFIEDFMEKYTKGSEENKTKFIKISLFGLSKVENIDELIFQKLHPILGSKYAKFTGSMLRSAFKIGLNFDMDGDEKTDGKLSIDPKDFSFFSSDKKSTKELIFIFDDLERTEIKLSEILGYINYLVEQSNFKVIVLADEDKLFDENKYKDFKEKVIGKTFEVQQDFDQVLNYFLKLAINSQDLLEKNKKTIQEIYYKADYKNLRHLRQTILDFDYLIPKIKKKYIDNNAFIVKLIYTFFALSIEIKKGQVKPEDFEKFTFQPSMSSLLNDKDEPSDKTDFEKILDKYSLSDGSSLLLGVKNWENVLFKSNIIKKEIDDDIGKLFFFNSTKRDSWINLWYFRDLEEKSFIKNLESVLKKFDKNEYFEHEVILHVTGILLHLSSIALVDRSKDEIISQTKKNINQNISKEKWQTKYFEYDNFIKAAYSLGYYSNDTKEFIDITNYLVEKSKEAFELGLKKKADKLLLDFKYNKFNNITDKFDKDFYNVDIFKAMDRQAFISMLLKMEHTYIRQVSYRLSQRYKDHRVLAYVKELDFWLYVNTHLLGAVDKKTTPLKYYLLESLQKYYINNIVLNQLKSENEKLYKKYNLKYTKIYYGK